jgi:hypothetical protein
MVQESDKLSLSGSARNRGVKGRIQDHLGLLTCIVLTKVPQELKYDPLVERELWFPGRPRGEDEPRNSAFHESASPSLHVQE